MPTFGALLAATSVPLVSLLANAVGEQATYADADDVAMLLRSLSELRKVADIFEIYAAATGLRIKPAKCVIVPLPQEAGGLEATERESWRLLAEPSPHWTLFRVGPSAMYLGMQMGPGASRQDQWSGPVAKHARHVTDLAQARLAPSITAQMYMARAVPVIGLVLDGLDIHSGGASPSQQPKA